MQKLLLMLTLVSGLALAQDNSFEREFSKFDKDFERLNSWKAETPASKKLKRTPAANAAATESPPPANGDAASKPAVTPLDDGTAAKPANEPAGDKPVTDEATSTKPLQSTAAPKKLPKGAKVEKLARNDLLGNQISDPEVRKKVQELYQRPDVVVQQYVLPTN
jgi:hypothetical protein